MLSAQAVARLLHKGAQQLGWRGLYRTGETLPSDALFGSIALQPVSQACAVAVSHFSLSPCHAHSVCNGLRLQLHRSAADVTTASSAARWTAVRRLSGGATGGVGMGVPRSVAQSTGTGAIDHLELHGEGAGLEVVVAAKQARAGDLSSPVSSAREHDYSGGQRRSLPRTVLAQLASTFLPAGYPASVGPGYLPYISWQTLQHTLMSANGTLASSFLLYAVGLGAGAIPTAGAINWVLKDGLGQLGTLLFGKTIAHNFDINTKTWYLMAALIMNASLALEISTFLTPTHFLLVGALANTMKGLSWMAGGSTRSAINVSFQRNNNIADITAKATSQHIASSVMGTAAGASIAAAIGQDASLAFTAFAGMASVHMYSAYRCVKGIPLSSLNPTRLQLLVDAFMADHQASRVLQGANSSLLQQAVPLPGPEQLAFADPALYMPAVISDNRFSPRVRVGTALAGITRDNPQLLALLLQLYASERHMVVPHAAQIHIILHSNASPEDGIAACLHACLLRKQLQQDEDEGRREAQSSLQSKDLRAALACSLHRTAMLKAPFIAGLQRAGWDTSKVVIEAKRQRAMW